MDTAWIAAARRTAFTRAGKGAFATTRPDELLATVFRGLLASLPPRALERIDEVIVGCAYPEAEQGRNAARIVALRAGLPDRVPAMTLTRMCASSLEATAVACDRVRLGEARMVLVGGMESMTMIPMGGIKPAPNTWLQSARPDAYLTMGQTAEEVATAYRVSRADQDAYALRSHQRVAAARERGVFAEEIVPLPPEGGGPPVAADDALRPDTTLGKLASLPPIFRERGSVTAGNACPTNDGASALIVASEAAAKALGFAPLGRFVSYAVAGVSPRLMGIGPVEAAPIALERAKLEIGDLGAIELNEAFASQVLAVIRALKFPEDRTNVNGGAIAIGHPLGATGARLVGTLLRQLKRSRQRYGLATLCVGGGMGAAMVLENPDGEGGRRATPAEPGGAPWAP
jgi:acetyl-CoA acyltransferase